MGASSTQPAGFRPPWPAAARGRAGEAEEGRAILRSSAESRAVGTGEASDLGFWWRGMGLRAGRRKEGGEEGVRRGMREVGGRGGVRVGGRGEGERRRGGGEGMWKSERDGICVRAGRCFSQWECGVWTVGLPPASDWR